MQLLPLIGAAFCLLGMLFLALGLGLFLRKWLSRRGGARARGVVASVERVKRIHGGRRLFRPTVRFETADGQPVEFQEWAATNTERQPGDVVEVVYDPRNPTSASIDTGLFGCFLPGMLTVLGAIILVVGIAMVVVSVVYSPTR